MALKAERVEHCVPVINWLIGEPEEETPKKYVVKIKNVPRRATEAMLLKQINKWFKNLKYDKIALEWDDVYKLNTGVAYFASSDKKSII